MGYIKIHLKYSHGKFIKIIPFKIQKFLCTTHSVSYNINVKQKKTQLLYGIHIWKLEELELEVQLSF